jgi:hypothetical protein
MKKILFGAVVCAITVGMSVAQNSAPASGSASQSGTVSVDQLGARQQSGTAANANAAAGASNTGGQVQAGSIIYAELDKSVDAKKAKVGDQVVAKVQQAVLSRGKVVAPKGSRIVGHVTQVKARTKDQAESALGLSFDQIVLKDGSKIPVSIGIQAISSGRTVSDLSQDAGASTAGPMSGNPGMPGHSNPGAIGGAAGDVNDVTRGAGSAAGTVADTAGATTGQVGAGTSTHVSASSHGVIGIPDLSLSAGASDSTGAVITSSKRNVKLESGSELVLRVR